MQASKLIASKKALAIPVTYLFLFVSLIALVSMTYGFAITKIGTRSAAIKVTVAKQNMQALDNTVQAVVWSFGASEIVYMDDCGSVFRAVPSAKRLTLNFTDEQTFSSIVFNNSLGKVFYNLEPSEFNDAGLYVRGDGRAIINQTAYSMSQLNFVAGGEAQEIVLCYRPLVTVAVVGTQDGRPLNLARIHIINLSYSQNLGLTEKFYLKIASLNVTANMYPYVFNQSTISIALKANFDGVQTTVWLPISSNTNGAVVNLETMVCNIKIQSAGA